MRDINTSVPAVSVLLTCYNSSRWLNEAIDSVRSQTLPDFEFIIVNDGSTDKSLDIIKRFAEKDSRIVVITKSNTGLADSLNVGIQRARGEWVARLDADDICEPGRLEMQLSMARKFPGVVFVGSGLKKIDENGSLLETYSYPENHELLLKSLCHSRKFPPHSSAFYSTHVVREVGGYRPRMKRSQDWDLWLRLSEVGQLISVRDPLVRIRQHRGQISNDSSGRLSIVYSNAALSSYWLRHHGFCDPVAGENNICESFLSVVEDRLNKENCFKYVDYINNIKIGLRECQAKPFALSSTSRYIFSHPFFLGRFVRENICGGKMSRRIALDWIAYVKYSQQLQKKGKRNKPHKRISICQQR